MQKDHREKYIVYIKYNDFLTPIKHYIKTTLVSLFYTHTHAMCLSLAYNLSLLLFNIHRDTIKVLVYFEEDY